MKTKKISELPDFEGKEYVLEAQRRGVEAAFPHITNSTDIILIGELSGDALERFHALAVAAEREACLNLVNQGTGEATSADALRILRMEWDRNQRRDSGEK